VAREADLYVLPGVTLLLLVLELFRNVDARTLAHASGAIILAGIVTVGCQMIVQAGEEMSIQRQERLLELDPNANTATSWEFLGQHFLESGRGREAYSAYSHAWDASDNPRHAVHLSTLCLQLHRPEEAEQWARIAVKAFPESMEAQASLGASLYAQGKIGESAEPLEKALRGGLADPTLVLLLSDAWVRVGRAGDAVELLDRAFHSGLRASGNLLTVMAQAQEILGHQEIAARLYQQALQLKPQEPFRSRAQEGWGRLQSKSPNSPTHP
jgi:tetratricopeptide (TPR) repeat protein